MNRWVLGAIIALGVTASAIVISYVALGGLYGTTQREVYMRVENTLTQVVPQTMGDAKQSNPYVLTYENNENTGASFTSTAWSGEVAWDNISWYQDVSISSLENVTAGECVLNSPTAQMEPLYLKAAATLTDSDYVLTVNRGPAAPSAPATPEPPAAYTGEAGYTEEGTENNTNVSFFVHETKPINILPIAASIGIAVGVAVFAIWIGYRQAWGDATSTLLEQGLHDMTVRDIEIVGYIMQKGEFTIPEIIKLTNASKITVWRTVQKLVEQGLVKPTEDTKPASNGLGGRGKPSQIYKYVGEKGKPKPQTSPSAGSEPKQVP
jgi:hypothetical protein